MMSKKIVIAYYKGSQPNFGDEIGQYIVKHLSDKPVVLKDCYIPFFVTIRGIVSNFVRGRRVKVPFFSKRYLLPLQKHLLAVGSILGSANCWSEVWGSGFMYKTESLKVRVKNIYAVRGYKTLEKIQELYPSFTCPVGDPALLLPIIYPHERIAKKEVALIPHFKEYVYFKTTFGDKYDIIDLRTDDVEKIIDIITSYKYILTTSLHGLIVAHAYGVPALWMEYSGLEKGTEGFKFYDYLSSVGIESYKPFKNISGILVSNNNIKKMFEDYTDVSLPKDDLLKLQKALINAAPFDTSRAGLLY